MPNHRHSDLLEALRPAVVVAAHLAAEGPLRLVEADFLHCVDCFWDQTRSLLPEHCGLQNESLHAASL